MLRPLNDRILVKPQPFVHSTIIEVVSDAKETIGEVVRLGPKATGLEIGDKVRFGTTEGYLSYTEFLDHGERFLVMSVNDVCFVEESTL